MLLSNKHSTVNIIYLFLMFYFVLVSFVQTVLAQPVSFSRSKPSELTVKLAPEISTDTASLCAVANNSLHYLNSNVDDGFAVHAGKIFSEQTEITLARVKKTLNFICQIQHEDQLKNQSSRLANRDFLLKHFTFIRWQPDTTTAHNIAKKSTNAIKTRMLRAIPDDKLFLTKYYTKLLTASVEKTAQFNQALYALPYDEQKLSLEDVATLLPNEQAQLNRFKFTRQQIIAGALLDKNIAKPLVWLTEEALHDVLLQGTGVLNVDGKTRYFNVHRNNGIAYDYSIGKREQARYWYFIETPEIMGYGKTQASKIAIKPQVTLAGNIAQLGLGKLIMLNYASSNEPSKGVNTISRLAILADQGGAFDDNLFQLDLLVDSYKGWQDYHQANKHLPDYAEVWLMIVK